MKIRYFEKEDFRRVMEIEEEAFLGGNPLLYMELYESCPEGFFVAEKDGIVIGFMSVVLSMERMWEGRIFAIAVDKRYQGKGVGRVLLKTAFEALRKRGFRYVRLEVRESNYVAQNLYRSLGFLPFGFVPSYYENGEGAIQMRKVL